MVMAVRMIVLHLDYKTSVQGLQVNVGFVLHLYYVYARPDGAVVIISFHILINLSHMLPSIGIKTGF